MQIIKEIIEEMEDEIDGAEHYADMALKYKDRDKILSDMYYNMSTQEFKHFDDLHNQIVRMIGDYRSKNGEPPKEMQAIYDWEHKKAIERAKKVKAAQSLYK